MAHSDDNKTSLDQGKHPMCHIKPYALHSHANKTSLDQGKHPMCQIPMLIKHHWSWKIYVPHSCADMYKIEIIFNPPSLSK